MAYQLFNKSGNPINHHDLQDKSTWCQAGATIEQVFVNKFGSSLNVKMNPQKQTDPYAPDLVEHLTHHLADLKTQNTPFFQALQRYNLDPQTAVVFNVKDSDRYDKFYPDIVIYFWVDWVAVRFDYGVSSIRVSPMTGVWRIPFGDLKVLLSTAPIHSYVQRLNDVAGNAKVSFVLSLHQKGFVQVA